MVVVDYGSAAQCHPCWRVRWGSNLDYGLVRDAQDCFRFLLFRPRKCTTAKFEAYRQAVGMVNEPTLYVLPVFDFDLDIVCFHPVFFLWVLCCLLGFGSAGTRLAHDVYLDTHIRTLISLFFSEV